jgi:hypothetical protein
LTLTILPGGDLDCVSCDPAVQARFERWRQRACRHEDGYAASAALGNIASVTLLTTALRSVARRFPVLLGRVLYCGSHCGDHLTPRQVERLDAELRELAHVRLKEDVGLDRRLRPVRLERAEVRASGKELDGELRRVRGELRRLVRVALRLGKPIAF